MKSKISRFYFRENKSDIGLLISIYKNIINNGYKVDIYDFKNDTYTIEKNIEQATIENIDNDFCYNFTFTLADIIYYNIKNIAMGIMSIKYEANEILPDEYKNSSKIHFCEFKGLNHIVIEFKKGHLPTYFAEQQQQELLSIISEEPLETKKRGRL